MQMTDQPNDNINVPVRVAAQTGSQPSLSDTDQHHLDNYEGRLQLVRDRVGGVARGYDTGFYLFGEGGLGKSYVVLRELERLKADIAIYNSRMTGRGLYNALERFPSSIHVLEDMEAITRDRGAQGVLRSALWAQHKEGAKGPLERLVTWTTYKMEHSFIFTGGIIMIGNKPFGDLPELNAIKTRIGVMHLQASAYELRALMRSIAQKGYEHDGKQMTPEECSEVCEYLIAESLQHRRALDLRLLVNSFHDYLQWIEGDALCHWRDQVASRIRERLTTFHEPVSRKSREERKQEEQGIVREVLAATPDQQERYRLWKERTDKSESALYRRMAEMQIA
jgi:hypothetical protein